jgi:glycine/sarcosine N-methyltransferase
MMNDIFSDGLSKHWDEIIDWDHRKNIALPWLDGICKQFNVKEILDVTTGTGFDAINLSKCGYKVTATDLSESMLNVARDNAKYYAQNINFYLSDWAELPTKLHSRRYEAIICLGNSFACELDSKKRKEAIVNFYKLLSPGGILIIDHRNYDALLNAVVGADSYLYHGKGVAIHMKLMTRVMTTFSYVLNNGESYDLSMVPIFFHDMLSILDQVSFKSHDIYCDLKKVDNLTGIDESNTAVLTHVCVKDV